MLTPLKTKDDCIFVDRGWVNRSISAGFAGTKDEPAVVEGFVYKGDVVKQKGDSNILNLVNPELLNGKYSKANSTFVIKQMKGTDESKKGRLELLDKKDLMYWYCTPSTHLNYSRFWAFATILNLAGNLYVWLL